MARHQWLANKLYFSAICKNKHLVSPDVKVMFGLTEVRAWVYRVTGHSLTSTEKVLPRIELWSAAIHGKPSNH